MVTTMSIVGINERILLNKKLIMVDHFPNSTLLLVY